MDKKSRGPSRHVLQNPLLRKGGAHQKTNKARRKAEKMKIRKQALPDFFYLVERARGLDLGVGLKASGPGKSN